MRLSGNILKLKSELKDIVDYSLPIGSELLPMNQFVGKKICLKFSGKINCIDTGKEIKKSYNQGYSYDSFISKAACDLCIMKPEICHFDKGTCREPEWAKEFCFRPHYVYLANTSEVKIGITRETQIPTRWIDQGATQALPILKVDDRKTSGLLEVEFKKMVADKTNWRNMLKGIPENIDLEFQRDELFENFGHILDDYDAEDLEVDVVNINYPVLKYPEKVSSLSFDKAALHEGTLMGIKGQYLILDTGVLNIRKFQGYNIEISSDEV